MMSILAFNLPEQASTFAEGIDFAFNFILAISAFFFALIMVLTVLFCIKYRQRGREMSKPAATHNLTIETIWTVIPSILLVVIFYMGFMHFVNMAVPPANAYPINVTAGNYTWKFSYPETGGESGVLYVPVNEPVVLSMESTDFIHSLYVPAFRNKLDVMPGRYTKLWFQATKKGEFPLYCAEYCGISHSLMTTKVVVTDRPDFNYITTTVLGEGGKTPLELGKMKFDMLCSSCHTLDGSVKIGPSLKGIFGKKETVLVSPDMHEEQIEVDENYIRESLLTPNAKVVKGFPAAMSAFQGALSNDHIKGIIEFLKSQK